MKSFGLSKGFIIVYCEKEGPVQQLYSTSLYIIRDFASISAKTTIHVKTKPCKKLYAILEYIYFQAKKNCHNEL